MPALKTLRFLWNELHSTAFSEIIYRSWDLFLSETNLQQVMFPVGWINDRQVLQAFNNHFSSKAELCYYLKNRISPKFFFSWREKEKYQSLLEGLFPGQKETLLEEARLILEHQFSLLGKEMRFGGRINWHASDNSNCSWPLAHWSRIGIGDASRYGDIKPTWELNRHQHFLVLGRAYWWTGQEKYAVEFARQLCSWIEDNTAELGINWQSNLEIALRSIAWIWALNLFLEAVDEETLFEAVRVLIHNGRHLQKRLAYSRYCMRNNHLIGDAAGLAFIAQFLPELAEAGLWKRKALGILYQELPRQVYDDGVNFEQAISYHRFVLYLYFLVVRMEQMNGGSVPPLVMARLEQMFEYLQWMAKPDGSAPMTGDGDEARVVTLGNEEINDLRPALATGAVFWQRPDFKFCAHKLSEEVVWLCGTGSAAAWDCLASTRPKKGCRAFSKGGYYVMRSGWGERDYFLAFRNGPHADFHAHADQLHLELAVSGQDILTDSGTYIYNGKQEWRSFFRGTSAHNTVVVDHEPQAVPYRAFRWRQVGKYGPALGCFGSEVQWVQGEHAGYHRYQDPVTHQRGILNVNGQYILLIDTFSACNTHVYQTFFHFGEGQAVQLAGSEGCLFIAAGGKGLIVNKLSEGHVATKIYLGETEPYIQGWVSPRYGVRQPAPVLCFEEKVEGAWCSCSMLWPVQREKVRPKISRWPGTNFSQAWMIESEEVRDYVALQSGLSGDFIESDGRVVFIRVRNGLPELLFTEGGSNLVVKDFLAVSGAWEFLQIRVCPATRTAEIEGKVKEAVAVRSESIKNINSADAGLLITGGYGSWQIRSNIN